MKVPERHRVGLEELSRLPDESIGPLVSALRELPLKPFSRARLLEVIKKSIADVEDVKVEELVDALGALYMVLASTELTASELVPDVVDALSVETALDPTQLDRLALRLLELLSIDRLGLIAKASSLLSDYEHDLCQARIFTDIRPVFGESVDESPAAAVIVHTLRIKYHRGGQIEDFYVSMDSADLGVLKDLIERAESKTEAMKAVLHKADILHVNASLEDD